MQKITTPNGETLVVLPLDEYQRMMDQIDIADAEKIRADIDAGRDELVPSDVVNRLLEGENPVRVWRNHRSLSARDLAARTGLSAPYISEIESGKKTGSTTALKKIADALALTLDDLT